MMMMQLLNHRSKSAKLLIPHQSHVCALSWSTAKRMSRNWGRGLKRWWRKDVWICRVYIDSALGPEESGFTKCLCLPKPKLWTDIHGVFDYRTRVNDWFNWINRVTLVHRSKKPHQWNVIYHSNKWVEKNLIVILLPVGDRRFHYRVHRKCAYFQASVVSANFSRVRRLSLLTSVEHAVPRHQALRHYQQHPTWRRPSGSGRQVRPSDFCLQ